jgi:hypothetical protein
VSKSLSRSTLEPVDRLGRMMGYDIENNLTFFAVGLLYIMLDAGCDNSIKSYTYFMFAHHIANISAQRQEISAFLWTLSSSGCITICLQTL